MPELLDQVSRTLETSIEDLPKMSLMVVVAPVNLEGTSNGSSPLRFDGATSSGFFFFSQDNAGISELGLSFHIDGEIQWRGIHKPAVSTLWGGFLNTRQTVVMGKAPGTAYSPLLECFWVGFGRYGPRQDY